jgi:cystathionine beta-lyase family protein involved in aluminum resistance
LVGGPRKEISFLKGRSKAIEVDSYIQSKRETSPGFLTQIIGSMNGSIFTVAFPANGVTIELYRERVHVP